MTDKGLISKIYKQLIQRNTKKPPNNLIKKQAGDLNIHIPEKYIFRWQKVHEKMLNITKRQRNANQNHNEILPHICQNNYDQNVYNKC